MQSVMLLSASGEVQAQPLSQVTSAQQNSAGMTNTVCCISLTVCAVLLCAVLQGAVRPPDAQTDPKVGHVGPVNDLVQCGPYVCSAGKANLS